MSNSIQSKRGVTLLELLVVIMVLAIAASLTIPIIRPSLETTQIREATRLVSSTLEIARNRARESGRTVGVLFEPAASNINTSYNLFFVESPPAFSGLSTMSAVVISNVEDDATVTVTFTPAEVLTSLVRSGDLLKLNYQGHLYRIESLNDEQYDSDGDGTADANYDGDANPEWILVKAVYGALSAVNVVNATADSSAHLRAFAEDKPLPFQIFRRPILSAAQPVELPTGAAVDLRASGIGDSTLVPTITNPVMITFSPSGQIDRIYDSIVPSGRKITAAVFLLVGRPDQTSLENLTDLDNQWVAIGYQTGTITAKPNAVIKEPFIDLNNDGLCCEFPMTDPTLSAEETFTDVNSDGIWNAIDPATTSMSNLEHLKSARRYARTGGGL